MNEASNIDVKLESGVNTVMTCWVETTYRFDLFRIRRGLFG